MSRRLWSLAPNWRSSPRVRESTKRRLTADITDIMAESKRWLMPPVKADYNFDSREVSTSLNDEPERGVAWSSLWHEIVNNDRMGWKSAW